MVAFKTHKTFDVLFTTILKVLFVLSSYETRIRNVNYLGFPSLGQMNTIYPEVDPDAESI